MNSKLTVLALVISCLGMTACAGKLTKDQCAATDFYEMGLRDGKKGNSQEKFQKDVAVCKDQGVTVPADKYAYGRKVGLTDFCSDSLAARDARKGAANEMCVAEAVPPYMSAYNAELAKMKGRAEADFQTAQKAKAKADERAAKLQGKVNQINDQEKSAPAN